jgi:GT2 family glycosyltransferase
LNDALSEALFTSIWRFDVSVGAVVVSHNSAEDLGECLVALQRATDLERVVVVDNDSRDASREIVQGFDDPRITLLSEDVNTGFAGGCNRGFGELGHVFEYLAFLNPDVVVSVDCLQHSVAALCEDPKLAGVAPLLMRSDGDTVDTVGQVLTRWTLEVADRGYGRPPSAAILRPTKVLAACGALAVFRRSALAEVAGPTGPWAQHYFCFWEDLELGWRLVNSGWGIQSCPQAVASHRRGAGAAAGGGPLRWRRPPELEACVITNRWMTLIRHLHPLDLLPRLPLLLLWDSGLVTAGALHRPALLGHLRRRWPMVVREWSNRSRDRRRRLHELQ